MSNISENLKLLREEADLSILELSEKTSIDERLINAFEMGQIEPNDYQLEVLCKVLKMPSDEIAYRNLKEERKNATKEMKQQTNRTNYNWYFGNKKHLIFYICYLAFFVVGVTSLVLIYTAYFKNGGFTWQMLEDYYYLSGYTHSYFLFVIEFFWANMKTGLIIFSLGVSFFILFEYFSTHRFIIRWWYIFWISLFTTFVIVLGLVGAVPYFIIVLIKIFTRKY